MWLYSAKSMRSSEVKSMPFVARVQYADDCVVSGQACAGAGSSDARFEQKRYAEGAAVKFHLLGVVLKTSAMGAASASLRFIGGRPRTSSIVRTKLMVLDCAETSAFCLDRKSTR